VLELPQVKKRESKWFLLNKRMKNNTEPATTTINTLNKKLSGRLGWSQSLCQCMCVCECVYIHAYISHSVCANWFLK